MLARAVRKWQKNVDRRSCFRELARHNINETNVGIRGAAGSKRELLLHVNTGG